MPRAGENTYILLRLLTKHLYCFSKLRDYRLQIGIIESNNNRRIILYPIRISDVRRHESEIRFTRRGMKPKLKKAIAHTLLAISCLTNIQQSCIRTFKKLIDYRHYRPPQLRITRRLSIIRISNNKLIGFITKHQFVLEKTDIINHTKSVTNRKHIESLRAVTA